MAFSVEPKALSPGMADCPSLTMADTEWICESRNWLESGRLLHFKDISFKHGIIC